MEEREKMSQKRKEITNYRQIERLRYIHESLSSGSYPTTQKLTYIAEDCSYDKGYWLYIILEHTLLEAPEEVARVELKNLIDFTRKA